MLSTAFVNVERVNIEVSVSENLVIVELDHCNTLHQVVYMLLAWQWNRRSAESVCVKLRPVVIDVI